MFSVNDPEDLTPSGARMVEITRAADARRARVRQADRLHTGSSRIVPNDHDQRNPLHSTTECAAFRARLIAVGTLRPAQEPNATN